MARRPEPSEASGYRRQTAYAQVRHISAQHVLESGDDLGGALGTSAADHSAPQTVFSPAWSSRRSCTNTPTNCCTRGRTGPASAINGIEAKACLRRRRGRGLDTIRFGTRHIHLYRGDR